MSKEQPKTKPKIVWRCPVCSCHDIRHQKKKHNWYCRKCGTEFDSEDFEREV